VDWSWDRTGYGETCETWPKNSTASIAPGSGAEGKGQLVTQCGGRFTSTPYCEVGKGKLTEKTTVTAHFVDSDGVEIYGGRAVATGCSIIATKGQKYPDFGQCCFP
jgi:hypothetical protein